MREGPLAAKNPLRVGESGDHGPSLAAHVHASITTGGREFGEGFAVVGFVSDVLVAAAVVPALPLFS